MPTVFWALSAAGVLLFFLVARSDFLTQKISNERAAQIAGLGLAFHAFAIWVTGSWAALAYSVAVALALFVVLFVFWLLGKVGAGDVKLMGATLLALHPMSLTVFAIALLLSVLATYGVMKYPNMLPERGFRVYVQHMSDTGRVPFGVPISAAAIATILYAAAVGSWTVPVF